jgi:tRNA dimethylallyltransferase
MVPLRPFVLLGATATGKSALAMELAEHLPIEIVNADALQVYRGFDLGTAKPSAQERARVPHHLIDILEPEERYSAGEFARRGREVIAEIVGRGRLPVVVGGSGLYLRALLSGISPIPSGDETVRQELRARLEREGLPALRAELADLDPETAGRLSPGDTQRVLRALEVRLVSGLPLSAWIARKPFGIQSIAATCVGLTLPRAILYDRIADRVSRMLKGGWVAEVEKLLEQGLDPTLPPFQAIGYRQLARSVREGWPLAEAIEETIRATRRFAKRQETWFRKEPDVAWLSAEDLHRVVPHVLEQVERSGRGEGL